ncbi:MAG: gamma-glutamyl-gamma-aminobutyrate hydrolase family protein [Deltaproteobacteria bacterium]|jgi:putative glutamine amidotransferase|nr:gamma-glutamyl-gamma-aminobutyrate hydrolase family protein [Deltaproteobacteria bacterium]
MGSYPLIVVTASQRFTSDWNGKHLAQVRVSYQYCDALYRAGGLPMVVGSYTGVGDHFFEGRGYAQNPPRKIEPLMDRAQALLDKAKGLVLTGGGDVLLTDEDGTDSVREMDRDRDFWEAALLKAALAAKKPILGVCRGLQLMNVYLGGDLWDDIPSDYPNPLIHQQISSRKKTSHDVLLDDSSKLAKICGSTRFAVNSGHHQAAKNVAGDLAATGHSPDGLIEVLEHRSHPWAIAVQWHPEALAHKDDMAGKLFKAFVDACRELG